ncbi:MAG: LapA family protein [Actinobacteria bacterium]|nr:LapA family protein [Actinomycetota bacterium]
MGGADARHPTGRGMGFKQGLLVVCGVLLVLFFVLNFQQVKVHLLVATVEMPLIIALAIAAVLGWVLGWAVPRLRRGGKSDAGS